MCSLDDGDTTMDIKKSKPFVYVLLFTLFFSDKVMKSYMIFYNQIHFNKNFI